MDVDTAEMVWSAVAGYVAIGGLVGLLLTLGLVGRFDPLAAKAPWRVRLLWLPGMTALWPLLLVKTLISRKAS